MLVTSKINIDLVRGTPPALLMTHQGDVYTRAVEVSLSVDGSPWSIPGCEVAVRYLKPDGTGGMYNKLPDGTTACSINDNKIVAKFAPQMFTVPGLVRAELQLYTQTEVLHTFAFDLLVQRAAASGEHSEDYFNLLPISMVGDLNDLDTDVKSSLVAAVNEVNQKVAVLSIRAVKSVNGTQPDETGDVKVLADDLDVVIQELQFQGSIVDAIKTLYGLCVLKVNYLTPKNGALVLTSDSIPMDDGDYQWGPISITKAIEQTWGKIPSDSTINSLIDAKLAQLPFAEGVTFNG